MAFDPVNIVFSYQKNSGDAAKIIGNFLPCPFSFFFCEKLDVNNVGDVNSDSVADPEHRSFLANTGMFK